MNGPEPLARAADGLFYLSETDAPFAPLALPDRHSLEQRLRELAGQDASAPVEVVSLDHFLRNQVTTYPGADAATEERARRFRELKRVLETELRDVAVYRVGTVQVAAFIIGTLPDGSLGGLRTQLVET